MEWLESLKSFHKHLEAGEYSSAVALAPLLLEQISPLPSKAKKAHSNGSAITRGRDEDATLRDMVVKAYARCLLETEDFAGLKKVLEQYRLEQEFSEWYRYASYRLNDFCSALVDSKADDSSATKTSIFDVHLRAQALYHLFKTDEAAALYQDLLERRASDDDRDEQEQVLVNWTAALFDQAAPYVRQSRSKLQSSVQAFLDAPSFPVDLAYNFASLRLLEGDASARFFLELALRHATEARDLERIRYNLEWSRHLSAGSLPSTNPLASDPHVQLAQLATQGVTSDDAKFHQLTVLQSRMALYNAAVHRLRQGKVADCQKVCKSLLAAVGSRDLYWTSRAVAVQVYCCDKAKGLDLVQGQLDKVRQNPESPVRDAAWLFLEVHRAELAGDAVNVAALPPSMQMSNGVLASQCLLQSSSEASRTSLSLSQEADREMSFKEYSKASEHYRQLLEQSSSTDRVARARLVAALSHVDPQQAISMWGNGQPTSSWDHSSVPRLDDEELNGAELEQRELPRLKTHRAAISGGDAIGGGSSAGLATQSSKKSEASVTRRRAKKREQYLRGLEEKGLYNKDRPSNPDPERWLPKVERSHYRKTKKGGPASKGSQGGVSEKDAAKLDVVARQQQQQQGKDTTATNTAHLAALSRGAGGGRKGGRRR